MPTRARCSGCGASATRTVPGREIAFVLGAEAARRVLDGSPEPFAPANLEKRAALGHFQPAGVLVSHGAERARRRAFNERVLQPHCEAHELHDALLAKVEEEAAGLAGELTWDRFAPSWWRLVRRI